MAFTNTTIEQTFNGDGIVDTFAIPFAYIGNSQVKVYLIVSSVPTLQTEGADYTIVNGDVVMGTAPAVGEDLKIKRETTLVQELDLINTGPYQSGSIEEALDRLVMIVQELEARVTELEA